MDFAKLEIRTKTMIDVEIKVKTNMFKHRLLFMLDMMQKVKYSSFIT